MDQHIDFIEEMIVEKAKKIFSLSEEKIYYLTLADGQEWNFCRYQNIGTCIADFFAGEGDLEPLTVLDFLENMSDYVAITEAEAYLQSCKSQDLLFLQKCEAYIVELIKSDKKDMYKEALEHFQKLMSPGAKVKTFSSREAAHKQLIGLGAKHPRQYGNLSNLYAIKIRDVFGGEVEFLFSIDWYNGVETSEFGIFLIGYNVPDFPYYGKRFLSVADLEQIKKIIYEL